MKNSIDQSQEETGQQQPCSEKACATCFENRGCMYDRYIPAMTSNTNKPRPQQVMETLAQQISRRPFL